jgi:hypothetical protein
MAFLYVKAAAGFIKIHRCRIGICAQTFTIMDMFETVKRAAFMSCFMTAEFDRSEV